MDRQNGLTNDRLKLIAAAAMLVDHIGAYLLPQIVFLRIVGRIAFPIFAFMIAEGCRYTKNKGRYLGNMVILAVFCQLAFYPFKPPLYMRIPVTFTLAIVAVYALQHFKTVFYSEKNVLKKLLSVAILVAVINIIYTLNIYLDIDYGFWGCMTPAIISFAHWQHGMPQKLAKYDNLRTRLSLLTMVLLFIYNQYGGVQIYSLLAVPLILQYNGKRENTVSKYFFYIFYPLHLAVIFAISYL